MIWADQTGWTWTIGGSRRLGGSSGTPTAGGFPVRPRNPSERAGQGCAQAGHSKDARARVRADHRPDLRDELRVAPVDLPPALGHPLGDLGDLDVLDGERVAAVLAPLLEMCDQAIEGAARGAHALHRLHLTLDREDRLDLERRADPRPRGADAAAPAQVLERVQVHEDLQVVAEGAGRRHPAG